MYADTDIVVTTDHGFSTVSRHDVDAQGHATRSYSATVTYRDAAGQQEVPDGALPGEVLSIDLAHALNLPLCDPDMQIAGTGGTRTFVPVDPMVGRQTTMRRQRPLGGGLIGGTGRVGTTDAKVLVAGNSIYVPDHDTAMVSRVAGILAMQDYVGALFVHDSFGAVPGALPMSAIGLTGTAILPVPAIIVVPRSFSLSPSDPLMTSVIVSGAGITGQGNHGAFTRGETLTTMAAHWDPTSGSGSSMSRPRAPRIFP